MLLSTFRLQLWQLRRNVWRKIQQNVVQFLIHLIFLFTKTFPSDCFSGHALTTCLDFAFKVRNVTLKPLEKLNSSSLKLKKLNFYHEIFFTLTVPPVVLNAVLTTLTERENFDQSFESFPPNGVFFYFSLPNCFPGKIFQDVQIAVWATSFDFLTKKSESLSISSQKFRINLKDLKKTIPLKMSKWSFVRAKGVSKKLLKNITRSVKSLRSKRMLFWQPCWN